MSATSIRQVVDQGNGYTIYVKHGRYHPLQILSSVLIFPVCQNLLASNTGYEASLNYPTSSEVTWVMADTPLHLCRQSWRLISC